MGIFDESGGGVTELVMAMAFMIFFGASVYLIIYSGASAANRIDEEKNAQMGARTAISYINVRIRQFDAAGAVSAVRNGLNGGSSILLKSRRHGMAGADYDTWIFWDGGELKEVLSGAGVEPEWGAANAIAETGGFEAYMEGGVLTTSVAYNSRGARKTLSLSIALRGGVAA